MKGALFGGGRVLDFSCCWWCFPYARFFFFSFFLVLLSMRLCSCMLGGEKKGLSEINADDIPVNVSVEFPWSPAEKSVIFFFFLHR